MHLGPIRCAAVALAAALACTSDGPGAGGSDTDTGGETETTGAEAIAFADFFELAEQAYCGWAVRCGGFAEEESCRAVEFFDVIYPSGLLAAGVFDAGVTGGQATEYLIASHAAGRLEFDAGAAAACFAWVEARGCLEPGTYVPDEAELAGQAACAGVIRGTMVQNGPCLLSTECAPQEDQSVVCGFDPSCAEACCVGGCRTFGAVPVGTPCTGQTRCADGSFCASDPNTGQFTVCTAKKAVGAACLSFDECDEAGYCDFNSGKCKALLAEGATCFGFGTCQPGLFCDDPEFVGDSRCIAYALTGASCLAGGYIDGCSEIAIGCDQASNTCAALPGPGDECAPGGDDRCGPTASCDWNTNRCVALGREGEPCGYDLRCAGGLQCDGWDITEARCRAPALTSVCAVPGEDDLPQGT